MNLHERAAEIVSRHKEWTQELTKTDYRDERVFVYQQIREVSDDMAALIAAMDARLREIEADAERYRWLRDAAPDEWGVTLDLPNGTTEFLIIGGRLDAAIDAARKESAP